MLSLCSSPPLTQRFLHPWWCVQLRVRMHAKPESLADVEQKLLGGSVLQQDVLNVLNAFCDLEGIEQHWGSHSDIMTKMPASCTLPAMSIAYSSVLGVRSGVVGSLQRQHLTVKVSKVESGIYRLSILPDYPVHADKYTSHLETEDLTNRHPGSLDLSLRVSLSLCVCVCVCLSLFLIAPTMLCARVWCSYRCELRQVQGWDADIARVRGGGQEHADGRCRHVAQVV